MSGIEIAGLVLGALPLVIAALEHYEDVIDPMLAFKNYQGELGDAIVSLRSQHALFQQNIEILLRSITTDHQLIDMLDNASSKFWHDPGITQALEGHLGRAYPAYMRTITEIKDLMVKIAKKLDGVPGVQDLGRDGLEAVISQNSPGTKNGRPQPFQFSKRIKFTMHRKGIKRSMKDLRRCITELAAFQDNATRLAMADSSQDKRGLYRYSQPIDTVRQYTLRLFNGLSRAWCSRHLSHATGLLLECRRLLKNDKKGTNLCIASNGQKPGSERFFNLRLGIVTLPERTDWKVVRVEMLDKCDTPVQSRKRKVDFLLGPASSAPRPLSELPPLLPPAKPELRIVKNICRELKGSCQPCIGLCIDANGQLRGVVDAHCDKAYVTKELCLGDLLRSKRRLAPRDQYRLAITLASSLLQLSGTPWMMEGWDRERIFFHRIKPSTGTEASAILDKIDTQYPYLSFSHDNSSPISVNTAVKCTTPDSSKLLALGIMLIEICHGSPVASTTTPNLSAAPNSIQDELVHFSTAKQWLDDKIDSGEISRGFVRAINHCLQSWVDRSASISADPEFAKSIEENVLEPLEEEMHLLFDSR